MVEGNGRLRRARMWILVLIFVVLFGAIAAPTIVIVYVQARADDIQVELQCTILKAEVDQLQAIRRNGVLIEEIARNLGLPIVPPPAIEIPEVPAGCIDVEG